MSVENEALKMFAPTSSASSAQGHDDTPKSDQPASASFAFANQHVMSGEWNVQLGDLISDPNGLRLNPEAMPYRPKVPSPANSQAGGGRGNLTASVSLPYTHSSMGFTDSRSFEPLRTPTSTFSGVLMPSRQPSFGCSVPGSGATSGGMNPPYLSDNSFPIGSQSSFPSLTNTPGSPSPAMESGKNARGQPNPGAAPPGAFGIPMYVGAQPGMPPGVFPPTSAPRGGGGGVPMMTTPAGLWIGATPPQASPNIRAQSGSGGNPGQSMGGAGSMSTRQSPSLGPANAGMLASDIQSALAQAALPAELENCGATEEEMGALRVITQAGYRVAMIPPPLTLETHHSIWRRNHGEVSEGNSPDTTDVTPPPAAPVQQADNSKENAVDTDAAPDVAAVAPVMEDEKSADEYHDSTLDVLTGEDSLPVLLQTGTPSEDGLKARLEAYAVIMKRWYHHIVALLAVQSPRQGAGQAPRPSCPSLESVAERLQLSVNGPHSAQSMVLLYQEWSSDCEAWWKEYFGSQHLHTTNSGSAFGTSGRNKRESTSGSLAPRSSLGGSEALDSPGAKHRGGSGCGGGESEEPSPVTTYANMMAMMMSAAAQHPQHQAPSPSHARGQQPQPQIRPPPSQQPPQQPQQQRQPASGQQPHQQQQQQQQQRMHAMLQNAQGHPAPQQPQGLNFNLGVQGLPDLATTALLQQQAAASSDPNTVNHINALLLQHLLLQQHQLLQKQQQQQAFFPAAALYTSGVPANPTGPMSYPFQPFSGVSVPTHGTGQEPYTRPDTRQTSDINDGNANTDDDQFAIAFTADLLQNLEN